MCVRNIYATFVCVYIYVMTMKGKFHNTLLYRQLLKALMHILVVELAVLFLRIKSLKLNKKLDFCCEFNFTINKHFMHFHISYFL